MADAQDFIVGIAGIVIGGIVGFFSGFRLAKYQDQLARQRELDKERRDRDQDSIRQRKEYQQLPSLILEFDHNSNDCIYPHEYMADSYKNAKTVSAIKEKRTDLYISLIVRNEGSTTARNCIGELFKLEWAKNSNSPFDEISLQGRQELKWSFEDSQVDLAPDATKSLNLLIARSSDELLDVQVKIENSPLITAMKHKGTFRFTIAVRSDEVCSKSLTLAVLWEGNFNGQWSETNIWLA